MAAVLVTQLGISDVWVLAYVPATVIIGEALPKTVYQYHATSLAPRLAPILRVEGATNQFFPSSVENAKHSPSRRRSLRTEP